MQAGRLRRKKLTLRRRIARLNEPRATGDEASWKRQGVLFAPKMPLQATGGIPTELEEAYSRVNGTSYDGDKMRSRRCDRAEWRKRRASANSLDSEAGRTVSKRFGARSGRTRGQSRDCREVRTPSDTNLFGPGVTLGLKRSRAGKHSKWEMGDEWGMRNCGYFFNSSVFK